MGLALARKSWGVIKLAMEKESAIPKWKSILTAKRDAEIKALCDQLDSEMVLNSIIIKLMKDPTCNDVSIRLLADCSAIFFYRNGRADCRLWEIRSMLPKSMIEELLHKQLEKIWGLPCSSPGQINMQAFRHAYTGEFAGEFAGDSEIEWNDQIKV